MKCSKCGQKRHVRRSKKCPLFGVFEDQDTGEHIGGAEEELGDVEEQLGDAEDQLGEEVSDDQSDEDSDDDVLQVTEVHLDENNVIEQIDLEEDFNDSQWRILMIVNVQHLK